MSVPYLTADLPGIGGQIKQHLEDFVVEELPLYEPSGEGTHVYFRVRKAGIPTPIAVDRLARYMSVRPDEIGFAGLKDAQAITEQTLSLEHADPGRLSAYSDAQMRVLWASRHTNKLRPGHLAGNRFRIRIRRAGGPQLAAAEAILDVLSRRGVPNFFGHQRFGARGDTDRLGELLIRDDLQEFVAAFLGRSGPDDPPECRAARDAFDAGFYGRALDLWPRHYRDQRRALSAYKKKQRPGPAVATIDSRMRRFFVSAFQSTMFNAVLARRLDRLDRVLPGDMAIKHDSGAAFMVEDAAVEQPRADRFEISPSGPIFGYRSTFAEGEPGQIERAVLVEHNMQLEDFRRAGQLKAKGTRRALRWQIREAALTAGTDDHGPYIEFCFLAPAGAYATVAVAEITKSPGRSIVRSI